MYGMRMQALCATPLTPLAWRQAKEETDQYLRQLERQGRAEEVYGKGVQLIVPEECFVIKAKQAGGRGAGKVFINVCTSDKVRRACMRTRVRARCVCVVGGGGG